MIEEYERKINKTKSLLEEEKKRVAKKDQQYEVVGDSINIKANSAATQEDLLNNLTPEFKGKPGDQHHLHQSIK